MRKIKISAISKTAQQELSRDEELPRKNKLAIKVLQKMGGYTQELVSENPYICLFYFKKAPKVFEQVLSDIIIEIKEQMRRKGLEENKDFFIEVINE